MTQFEQDYAALNSQLNSLLSGETDFVCNSAQFSAFIFEQLEDINWAGFYWVDPLQPNELLLGPFQGKVACVRIPFDKGVCGKAASTRTIQRIEDVHQFEGHIACDAASNSEIVFPVLFQDKLLGVLDIDSPSIGRFSKADQDGIELWLNTYLQRTLFP